MPARAHMRSHSCVRCVRTARVLACRVPNATDRDARRGGRARRYVPPAEAPAALRLRAPIQRGSGEPPSPPPSGCLGGTKKPKKRPIRPRNKQTSNRSTQEQPPRQQPPRQQPPRTSHCPPLPAKSSYATNHSHKSGTPCIERQKCAESSDPPVVAEASLGFISGIEHLAALLGTKLGTKSAVRAQAASELPQRWWQANHTLPPPMNIVPDRPCFPKRRTRNGRVPHDRPSPTVPSPHSDAAEQS
jgi:hypothetical protein